MLDVTPPFLGVHVLVAIAKPLSREKFEASVKYFWNLITRLDVWIQSTSSVSHHQPDRMSAIAKCLQALALGLFTSHLFLGSEFCAGHEFEDVAICSWRRVSVTFSLTHLPVQLPSASFPPGHVFSPTHWHCKNSGMHPMVDIFVQAF